MIVAMGAGGASEVWGQATPSDASGVVVRPGLFARLGAARATVVVAPPGSGKTVLLRSWINEAGLADCVAWVSSGRDERDPQRFWLSVVGELRQTGPGSALVQPLTAAPDLDGWAATERLLTDLVPLADRIWLVVDDVHELGQEVLRQLELLIMRAPSELRFVLATRHDVRLGLHRLRLEGELTEIRAGDLRFSLADAEELFAVAGVDLPGPAVQSLVDRTEGWAAGLRLAALSAAGHPDPVQFAAEFSGTERTVSEYLLAEVLDRQPEPVRRLLLRTSILGRVNGELADLLTGERGGERLLQDLEQANAFVVSLDGARSWFRYHQMFAGLLQLELRRTEPGELASLHGAASAWFEGHGFGMEAVRHAQAAGDWGLAAKLLTGCWPGLYLDGRPTAIHELLAGFPAQTRAAHAVLAAVAAADELARGSLEKAGRYLELAGQGVPAVSQDAQVELLLGVVRLLYARQRGNPQAVAEEAQRLQASAAATDGTLAEELHALVLISLGSTEVWAASGSSDAHGYLEQGVALARRVGRPYLEVTGLAYQAAMELSSVPHARVAERASQAFELAERHGWTDEPAAGLACAIAGTVLAWQGRPADAEPWVMRAERALRAEAEPAAGTRVYHARGLLELARGRDFEAVAAFTSGVQLARHLSMPHYFVPRSQALLLHALVRLGHTDRAEQILAGLDARVRDRGDIRVADATLRLAQAGPRAAAAALAPVLDNSAAGLHRNVMLWARLLEAIVQEALGDSRAAGDALEQALDHAEPNGSVLPFLLYPAPGLLERQARYRTGHAALIGEILSLLSGNRPAPPSSGPGLPMEPLSESELRVLRYLPTNLSAPEIAGQLYVSVNTVKTHMRNLYAKLGTHTRAEAVNRARGLALLAPSGRSGR
jgi:LuxR family maltose regulon positive regulatory protein